MTKAGTFDEWMADTTTLINLIQELQDTRWSIREYDSPHFSFSGNGNTWTFKYSRVLEPVEDIRDAQATPLSIRGPLGSPHSYVNSQPSTQMSNMTRTTLGINQVIIVIGKGNCIQSVQWIRKPNTGLVLTNNFDSTFGNMAGGTVRGSFLFLPNMKILVNDKIYANDTPDAFTQDIGSEEEQLFRYLDLLAFREKYDGPIY